MELQKVNSKINDFFEHYDQELINQILNITLKELISISEKQNNKLENSFKLGLKKFYNERELTAKINLAICALIEDFENHLTVIDREKIQEEWETGVEKLTHKKLEEIESFPLEKVIGFSDNSIEAFYAAGLHFFDQKQFKKASGIFFILSLLNYGRHNVWISLGLAEQRLNRFEPSMQAFAMAVITNTESAYPYIYSAESCLCLSDGAKAKINLEAARKVLARQPQPHQEKLQEYMKQLEKRARLKFYR